MIASSGKINPRTACIATGFALAACLLVFLCSHDSRNTSGKGEKPLPPISAEQVVRSPSGSDLHNPPVKPTEKSATQWQVSKGSLPLNGKPEIVPPLSFPPLSFPPLSFPPATSSQQANGATGRLTTALQLDPADPQQALPMSSILSRQKEVQLLSSEVVSDADGERLVSLYQTDFKHPTLVSEQWFSRSKITCEILPEPQRDVVYVADHLLVHTQPGTSVDRLKQIATRFGAKIRRDCFTENMYLVSFAEPGRTPLQAMMKRFQSETADIAIAEPDYLVSATQTIPNDPAFGVQWALNNTGQGGGVIDADVDAPEAWDIFQGNNSVVCGVIDTGVMLTHPDLVNNLWTNPGEIPGNGIDDDGNSLIDDVHGYDFQNGDGDPSDDVGHGTHVAGIVASESSNAAGGASISQKSRIMALKFLGPGGNGSTGDATDCVNYARIMMQAGEPVRLTNNSWGGNGPSSSLSLAIANARSAGQLFVVSAGNGGSDNIGDDNDSSPVYPASYGYDNMVVVAATTRTDALASYSNFGATSVDLAAPGSSILSTYSNGGYVYLNGTSMASPMVASAASYLWSFSPGQSYIGIRDAILNGVDVTTSLTGKVVSNGRLNLYNSLQLLGLTVIDSVPQQGSVVTSAPTTFSVTFSEPINPTTLQGGDLLVNGMPGNSVSMMGSQVANFQFTTSPITTQGSQSMSIAAGAVLRADGVPLTAWSSSFLYDAIPLAVTSGIPALSSVNSLPFATFDLLFNESIDPASLAASDFYVSQGQVTGVSLVAGNQVRLVVSGVSEEGFLDVVLLAGMLLDLFGNPNVGFTGGYSIDLGPLTNLGDWRSLPPQGHSVWDRRTEGYAHSGDTDAFLVDLHADQFYAALVQPSAGLSLKCELRTAGGTVLSSVSGSPGTEVRLPPFMVSSAGSYQLEISTMSGTGTYSLVEALNSDFPVDNGATQSGTDARLLLNGLVGRSSILASHSPSEIRNYQVPVSGPVAVSIRMISPGSLNVNVSEIAGPVLGTVGVSSIALEGQLEVTASAGVDISVNGFGDYVLTVTELAAFNQRKNGFAGQAQDLVPMLDVVGGLPDYGTSQLVEIEPNDDGNLGGSQGDLVYAQSISPYWTTSAPNTYTYSVTGSIDEPWDVDWDFYRFYASPGDTVTIEEWGQQSGLGTLEDPTVRLYDRNGSQIAINDDIVSGVQRESRLVYTNFSYSGAYFVVADSWDYTAGSYQLDVELVTPNLIQLPVVDVYEVTSMPNQPVQATLLTHEHGPVNQFHNLSPQLEVLDGVSGAVLATGGSSVSYSPGASATPLQIQVSGAGTHGEYLLRVTNLPPTTALICVTSQYSSATPGVGCAMQSMTTPFSASVISPVTSGTTQYSCSGWIGSGGLSGSGTGSSLGPIMLTGAGSLTWLWQTNYYVNVLPATVPANGSVSLSSGFKPAGSMQTITATPAPCYVFTGWSGSVSGSANPLSFPVNSAVTVQPTFALKSYDLTVTSAYGSPVPAVGVSSYSCGANYNASVASPVLGAGGTTRYLCSGWTGTGDIPSVGAGTSVSVVGASAHSSLAWNWDTEYLLTTSVVGAGTVDVATGWVAAGSLVTLTATPNACQQFTGWTGSIASSANPITVTMSQAENLVANFAPLAYVLTVNSTQGSPTPGVGGTIYTCGSTYTASVLSPVTVGSTRYVCTGWTGSGDVPASGSGASTGGISVSQNSSITWQWQTEYLVTIGAGANGSVSSTGGWYSAGTVLNVTATPAANYLFNNWVGSSTSNSNPLSLTANSGLTYLANFSPGPVDLLVASPYGAPSPAVGITTYSSGMSITPSLSGSPVVSGGTTRYRCVGYSGTGDLSSGSGTSVPSFPITQNSSLTWNWETDYQLATQTIGSGNITDSGGITPASAWELSGSSPSLTAAPATGWTFSGWSGDTSGATISGNQIILPMNSARSVTATFVLAPVSLQVISPYGSPSPIVGTSMLPVNSVVSPVAPSTVTVPSGQTRYLPTGWSGSGSVSSGTGTGITSFSITQNSSLEWLWKTQHRVMVTPSAGGAVSGSIGWKDLGLNLSYVPIPMSGYEFVEWQGVPSAQRFDNPLVLTVTGPLSFNPVFKLKEYTLTVISPYGNPSPPVGMTTFAHGDVVTPSLASATVTSGLTRYQSTGWNGSGSFTMNQDRTVIWDWNTEYFVDIQASTNGTITPTSGTTPGVGSTWVPAGSFLSYSFVTNSGYAFANWIGAPANATVNGNAINFVVTGPVNLGAQASAIPSPLAPPSVIISDFTIANDMVYWASSNSWSYSIETSSLPHTNYTIFASGILATPPQNQYPVNLFAPTRFYRLRVYPSP